MQRARTVRETTVVGEPYPPGGIDALRRVDRSVHDAGATLRGADLAAEALALYAKVLAATTLPAAAHGLVTALAADFGYARASIGLHDRGRTRLLASSSLDTSNPQAELPQSLLGAMDEAIDQGVSLAWPVAAEPTGLDGTRIRIEHAALGAIDPHFGHGSAHTGGDSRGAGQMKWPS